MIVRIVQMTFEPEKVNEFLEIFKASQRKIKAFPGCIYLELLQQAGQPNVFFTYSHWQTEADLESYRQSEFFQTTWSKTKKLFAVKAEAFTLETYKL